MENQKRYPFHARTATEPVEGATKRIFCVLASAFSKISALSAYSCCRPSQTDNPHSPSFRVGRPNLQIVGVLRGNTIKGNTTRNSERKMAL